MPERPTPGDEASLRTLRELAGVELAAVSVHQPGARNRPTMASIDTDEGDGDTRVTVNLALDDRIFSGSASGPPNVPAINRTAAEATLRALEELVLTGYAIAQIEWLEVLEPPDAATPRVMHLAVLFRTAEREDLLVGSALVRDVEYEAAVRATLDALNRPVELLLLALED